MKHLLIPTIVLLAFINFSSGQSCQHDYHCSAGFCCIQQWHQWSYRGYCWNRQIYGRWCNSPALCDNNLNCRPSDCCRQTSPRGGYCELNSLQRNGRTMFCPQEGRTPCQSDQRCGSHECCRTSASGQGECVHLGHEGEVCSTVTGNPMANICPCDIGLECRVSASSSTPNTGVCKSPMNGCTSHQECQAKRKNMCCKSVGGPEKMCVTSADYYGKCRP